MTLRRRAIVSLAASALALLGPSPARADRRFGAEWRPWDQDCTEVSDTVGEHVCRKYGSGWSIENTFALTFRFGLRHGAMGTKGLRFVESFEAEDRPKGYSGYAYPGEALGDAAVSGLGMDGGFTFFMIGQLYTGIDGGVAIGSVRAPTFTAGNHTLSATTAAPVAIFHGGLPVGYRIPLGRASIRGEVLFGGAYASVTRKYDVDGYRNEGAARDGRWLVEPRIAGDIWFTQHITFSVYAGTNVVDSRGHAFGLSFAWHHRAFDGDMSLW